MIVFTLRSGSDSTVAGLLRAALWGRWTPGFFPDFFERGPVMSKLHHVAGNQESGLVTAECGVIRARRGGFGEPAAGVVRSAFGDAGLDAAARQAARVNYVHTRRKYVVLL